MPRTISIAAAALGSALVLFACQLESPTSPEFEDPDLGKNHGHDSRMRICHAKKPGWFNHHKSWGHKSWGYRKKEVRYEEIWIKSRHERWHRSHGDGQIGDEMSRRHGHVFGPHCKPERDKGSLTVIKMADAAGVFDFEGSPKIGEFQLATGDADLNVWTFEDLRTKYDYTILEIPQEGFTLTSASCTLEDGSVTGHAEGGGVTDIALQPGKTTTCTFVNESAVAPETGSLRVVKTSDVPGTFNFTASDPIGTFTLNTGDPTTSEQLFEGLDVAATYLVSELGDNPAFTVESASCVLAGGGTTGVPDMLGVSDIVIEAGSLTTCTFANVSVEVPETGSLQVIKMSDPPGTFNFTASDPIGAFSLVTNETATAAQTFDGLDIAMTYVVNEIEDNPGFTLESASCALEGGEATGTPEALGVSGIVIEPGLTTTCTFINAAVQAPTGLLRVVKTTNQPGLFDFEGSPTIGTFTLDTGDPSTSSQTFDELSTAVTYSIVENPNPGFTLINVMCNLDSGTPTGTSTGSGVTGIVVQEGLITSCSFVNAAVPQTGSLRVVKMSDAPGTWEFEINPTVGGFDLTTTDASAAEITFDGLNVSTTYTVSELPTDGFELESAVCVLEDDTPTGSGEGAVLSGVQVQPGMTTTCTFVNAVLPTFGILRVVASADAPGVFQFIGQPTIGEFQLDTSVPSLSEMSFEITDVSATYSIMQVLNSLFAFEGAACTLGDGTLTGALSETTVSGIQVELGSTTTCTFVNSAGISAPPWRGQ